MHDFSFDADEEFEQLEFESLETDAGLTAPTVRRGPSLKARAVDFLSRREHSRAELKRKLQRHCESESEIDALLTDLEKENWLSDERFAHSLVNRRAYKFGARRVLQELRQNGVPDEHISTVLEQLQDTEYDRALEVWQRKFGSAPADQKAYAKQYRFMASRGFSPDLLHRILDRLNDSL
ncbi:recombination regulator RecX [Paenalcaligenes faecalis]|uniref:recombination regulator RecX n=1 Tax=Paenalcaligenes faecalis TaxID=2980099 RepID=UPI0022B9B2C8|nr:recombination regulator RecX [Paenalcaligenes faecalis]